MPRHQLPDFASLSEVVSPRILEAARVASRAMTERGVRHALIGGLAVGAWGYLRATKGVDFVVGRTNQETGCATCSTSCS
jgi:hypothetical protein